MAFLCEPQRACCSAGRITAKLLLSFLVLSPTLVVSKPSPPQSVDRIAVKPLPGDFTAPGPFLGGGSGRDVEGDREFSLRHIMDHGTYKYPGMLRRLDIHPETLVATEGSGKLEPRPKYKVGARKKTAARLADQSKKTIESYLLAYRRGYVTPSSLSAWESKEIPQPNITDKDTVLALSKIAADAYIEVQYTEDWLEVGKPYNLSQDFGWQGDSLRGHIFADETNSTVIIGLKGTSMAVFTGADTTTNDKINDNLLFSCCCARISYMWSTVCDCYSGTAYTCNETCLSGALREENRYYHSIRQLYYNVTEMYPKSDVWLVGHSLGGALQSLLGQTFGLPVVAFEAPGEALASKRLGLPAPPTGAKESYELPIYHFGHTADPIYMGTCNGATSLCSLGGYAMETRCHAGNECIYDTVTDKGWRMGLGYHRIQGVIKDIIREYPDVPECKHEPDCVDCFNWKFLDGNETVTTTTTTSEPTTTTTTTTTSCKTPGWWGCRDPTTTTTATTTSATTATTTCTSYGWFGNCLDPTTTSTASSSSSALATTTSADPLPTATAGPTATSTGTCSHYGWFGGCVDPSPTSTAPTTSCTHPGRLWGCWDTPTASTPTPMPTPTPTDNRAPPSDPEPICTRRGWFGFGRCLGYQDLEL